jgi:hypothetical protein
MASFPTSVKSFSAKQNGNLLYAVTVNDLQDEVAAIETAILTGTHIVGGFLSCVAGESLAVRDLVYVHPNEANKINPPGRTAGRVYRVTNTDVYYRFLRNPEALIAGFVVTGSNAAGGVVVQTEGRVTGFTGLTVGAIYYALDTAGAIGTESALVWGARKIPVGIAISTTELFVNPNTGAAFASGFVGPATYGYAMGGHSGAVVATTDRITFSTSGTAASTVSNLTTIRAYAAGVSDTSTYGYAMGGYSSAYVATTDRITFSTSVTAASTVSNLSVARGYAAGVSDGVTYGYAMGGYTGADFTTTDRITFSTSTTAASTVSNLSVARDSSAGVSDGVTYGYAMGGYTGGVVATTDRITFSTSVTAASTVSNLSQARYGAAGVSDGVTYGYAMGGYTGARVTTTDRITFSTSVTAASTVSNLSVARDYAAGVSDGTTYGYAMGGRSSSGAALATTDRITFSTSTTAASTVSNLSGIRYSAAGVSDGAV